MRLGPDAAERKRHHDRQHQSHLGGHPVLAEDVAAPETEAIASASTEMSPAFIKGVSENLPNARLVKALGKRTSRACLCREQLWEILRRKQVNVVRRMLRQWRINVTCPKVEPMKAIAKMSWRTWRASSPRRKPARPTASSEPSTDSFKPPGERPSATTA